MLGYQRAVFFHSLFLLEFNFSENKHLIAVPKLPWAPATTRLQVVFYAAVFRASDMAKSRTNDAIQSMQKGQLVLLGKNEPWLRPLIWQSLNLVEFCAGDQIPSSERKLKQIESHGIL